MSYPIEGGSAHLRAVAVGEFTLEAFRERVCGDVVAKFEHSLYVRFARGAFACIGAQSIGAGPLNVLLGGGDWLRLRNVSLPQAVEASAGVLALGKYRIAFTGAARWHPRRSPVRRGLLAARLQSLTVLARRHVPRVGLSRLAFSPETHDADPVLRLARPGWNALESWLVHATAGKRAELVGRDPVRAREGERRKELFQPAGDVDERRSDAEGVRRRSVGGVEHGRAWRRVGR